MPTFREELTAAIEAVSAPSGFAVERSVAASAQPGGIAAQLDETIQKTLAAEPSKLLFYRVGSAIVVGLTLTDGRSLVAKAHQRHRTVHALCIQRHVQARVGSAGIPAPEPLAGPVAFGYGFLTIDAHDGSGLACADLPPASDANVRRLIAGSLNAIGRHGADLVGEASLTRSSRREPGSLYPAPHSPMFDFTATASGAEWIDALAARALHVIDTTGPLPQMVTHGDLRAENIRVTDHAATALSVIWDWDSIESASEARHVGTTARAFSLDFTRNQGAGTDVGLPTVAGMLAFIDDYESARGTPFPARERRAVLASTLHALAYSARCEHALDVRYGPVRWAPRFGDRLREFGASLSGSGV